MAALRAGRVQGGRLVGTSSKLGEGEREARGIQHACWHEQQGAGSGRAVRSCAG